MYPSRPSARELSGQHQHPQSREAPSFWDAGAAALSWWGLAEQRGEEMKDPPGRWAASKARASGRPA